MTASILALVLTGSAAAGKLAEGFRGIPYGDATSLADAPSETCVADPEPDVRWGCDDKIGDVPVTISYMVSGDLFIGVAISTTSYAHADALFKTLQVAWGRGRKQRDYDTSALPDWAWADRTALGSFKYNQYSDECRVLAFDRKVHEQAEAAKVEKAKAGAGDL